MAITGEFVRAKRHDRGSRIPVMTRLALLFVPIALGCSSDSTTAAIDAPSSTPDAVAGPDAPEMVTLTLNNFDAWCTVTEEGVAAPPTMMFPVGTVVHLNAGPVSDAFVWGYWTGTDGGAKDTKMSTTVTMSANKTVLACCPFKPPASQVCQ